MAVYMVTIEYEDDDDVSCRLVDLPSHFEAEVKANIQGGIVEEGEVSFGEHDLVALPFPFTGTVEGEFTFYSDGTNAPALPASSIPGAQTLGSGGIGFPGFGGMGGSPGKKFTSAECLDALIEKINNEPTLIRNHVQLLVQSQVDLMNNILWPAVLDAGNWTRLSTHRPTHDDEGEKLLGTDREVRTYENDVWADHGKILTAEVTTEYGEIISFKVTPKW